MKEPDSKAMPPAVILCGGQGTRLRDIAELMPKPMVPIGPHPILWHIMKGYASFGVKRFILCLGYKREVILDYFLNYHARATDVTIRLGRQYEITYHGSHGEEDWEVTLADTGDKTMTGGRVMRIQKYLAPDDGHFFLTYGDAVADIDLAALYRTHCESKRVLTVTAVHPAGRFGEMSVNASGVVTGFHEKPQTEQGFINGGFMVSSRILADQYLNDDPTLVFEQEPMQRILESQQLHAHCHSGFWQCMDTPREYALLNRLWDQGNAPWTRSWT